MRANKHAPKPSPDRQDREVVAWCAICGGEIYEDNAEITVSSGGDTRRICERCATAMVPGLKEALE